MSAKLGETCQKTLNLVQQILVSYNVHNKIIQGRYTMKSTKNQTWVYNNDIDLESCGEGIARKILAYSEDLMCVENHFETGAAGAMHHHPHTQITYVVSGKFEFTIGDEVQVVEAGDSMLQMSDIIHGCKCIEKGIILDIFTPMRKDFVEK